MRLLQSFILLGCTLGALAGIAAQGSDPVRATVAPTVTEPRPKQVGGSVSAPKLISVADMPGLTHISTAVVLKLWVDTKGVPSHIRVLQGGDSAENEKIIIAAVQQYRFEPAMENGKPVLVEMNLDLDID